MKVMSQGMSEDELKKNKKDFEEKAKIRIKVGLILNEFGEQYKVKVEEKEIQAEVQKQLRMMPGQEKMVMEFYQKNPSALASLRGNVYEEKIINLIKSKAKPVKKEITKEQAEKILKEANDPGQKQELKKGTKSTRKNKDLKNPKSSTLKSKKTKKLKKVSKK